MLSISKAQRFNNTLVDLRKQMKAKYDEPPRATSHHHENTFPSNHIPIYLKNSQQMVIIPP
jgi:hypothetical protein